MIFGISHLTRALQFRLRAPIKGLGRFARALCEVLPRANGWVRLPDGFEMLLDSHNSRERNVLFYGMYHPVSSRLLRERIKTGDHCLDIGANLGYYSLLMAQRAGKTGRVAAFEANPKLIDYLQMQKERNGFKMLQIVGEAVSDTLGQATFYIGDDIGKSSLESDNVKQQATQVSVSLTTIDHFIQQNGWQHLDVLKIDIEGYDVQALLGAENSLKTFKPFVIFEFWRTTPQAQIQRLNAILQPLGYGAYYLLPSGKLTPFNWQLPEGQKQVDVVLLCDK